ncbi:30S ribosomal protein S11 [candidate division WWE3 bacterium CG09_land_8_20_14_0_10_47_33]|uniref:Small ribosomal subunit protein uS11 n=1 Tax=candidate division WWE3 bacterium CG_4_9_14_0_2_um_filter_48_10 TaxID=1975078 RepID=A0A2M8EJW7_UNCKA|nr:MAG: 30S ribosomal protein S11 [candidate division WWE3 bacterium CG09_land_8_20_14_0_10_47_33]PIZ41480.1 MAG: 30S ribosomal protein S11 [candidate division WWE3 bacterium CG_4_10_14_0_2_um_filter_47_8]PJC22977.1 MAG: 30S ribosomal protein S11 [candidate division WWE3 bacterium CG_4_9_14_0_2_um_filter_48_10]PJE51219.1 MAG: 30S ribosomal protein S11 [candidate division WWE3 bacterium CG10_big_fil_rev_8_21_14_0_10_48_23]
MTKKKKERKIPEKAFAHILATFNNTHITITDEAGGVITRASAGTAGFKGTKKATPFAASQAAEAASKRATGLGVKEVSVLVKGPGAGRDSAIKALKVGGLEITSITDVTSVPHNGPRPKKRRRV